MQKYRVEQLTDSGCSQSWASDLWPWGDGGLPLRAGSHSISVTVAAASLTPGRTFDLYIGTNEDLLEELAIPADGAERTYTVQAVTVDSQGERLLVEHRVEDPEQDVMFTVLRVEVES
jgi:hypothetical protein